EGFCSVLPAVWRRTCDSIRASFGKPAPHTSLGTPADRVADVRIDPPLSDLEWRHSHRICGLGADRSAVFVLSPLASGGRRGDVPRGVSRDAGMVAAWTVARPWFDPT